MEKLIVKDKVFSVEHVTFSQSRPIKMLYKGLANPVFTIKANDYNLSTNKPHTTISFKHLENHTRDFLHHLDEIVPKIAFDRRKEWFTSDLHDIDFDNFVENYRRNISEYGFSIFLGPCDKDELPISCFIKDLSTSFSVFGSSRTFSSGTSQRTSHPSSTVAASETRKLVNSFQELAWGARNGQITILAQVTGLWIKEESYGLSWKVLQILYRRNPSLPQGCQVFLKPEEILAHTWRIPPDEADPVELPDEEDSILPDKFNSSDEPESSSKKSSDFKDKSEASTITLVSTDIANTSNSLLTQDTSMNSGIATSALSYGDKPYNPLLETDD